MADDTSDHLDHGTWYETSASEGDRLETWQEAKAAVQEQAKADGFGLVIRRSDVNRRTREVYKVSLVCNRGATYKARPEEEQRSRSTSTKKCGCPFQLNIMKSGDMDCWKVFIVHAEHNHEGAAKAAANAVHRRGEMTEEMLDTISKATQALQNPKQIWINNRKKNPRTGITIQDVYNAKKKIKHRALGKYTPTQAILRAQQRNNWFVRFQLDPKTRRVKRLFFVNKHIKEILSKNSEVIIMDCTYKTNKYRMPLLVIMGSTALGTSFYIAFAFLDGEEELDFNWVIEQLKELYSELDLKDPIVIVTDRDLALMNAISINYPNTVNILCVWHINRNVLKNCKAAFDTQQEWEEFLAAWHEVVYASTSAEHEEAWQSLKAKYHDEHEEEVEYLRTIWLDEYKERFCKAWTNEVLHFNSLTTSRVEGGHRVLKSVLKFSTGDLMTVVDRLETLLEGQYDDYTTKLEQAKMTMAFNLPRELMSDLIGRVSPHALQKIRKQWKKVKRAELEENDTLGPCSRSFATTMGLSCSHMIQACMDTPEAKLLLDDVHPHWRFKKTEFSNEAFTNNLTSEDVLLSRQLRAESTDGLPEAHELFIGSSSRMEPRLTSPPSEVEVNDSSKRIGSRSTSPPSENEELGNLLNINEPAKAKAKRRSKGSQNKKGTMTRAEKKAAKSTKRHPSGFELVERDIEQRAKRAKKEASSKSTDKPKGKINKKNIAQSISRITRGREARGRRGGGRGGDTQRITRRAATASQPVEISIDESSDDGFRNLQMSSSDEDFNDSLDGDEEARDDWIH